MPIPFMPLPFSLSRAAAAQVPAFEFGLWWPSGGGLMSLSMLFDAEQGPEIGIMTGPVRRQWAGRPWPTLALALFFSLLHVCNPCAPASQGVHSGSHREDRMLRGRLRGGGIHLEEWVVVPARDVEGFAYTEHNMKLQEAAERGDLDAIDRFVRAGIHAQPVHLRIHTKTRSAAC